MKDYILELVSGQTSFNAKLNTMREYLQTYILRILFEEGMFHSTAFVGGTALRLLYNLPRYSEDLDFSVTRKVDYSFTDILKKIKKELALAGYDVYVSYKEEKAVQHAFVRFQRLMFDAGVSSHPEQKFSVKIEIDTNPPEGAALTTHVVNKYFPLSFLSYDVSSLFAGKVHALFSRKCTKGRDFFDLGWYVSKWRDISPNIIFLRNALLQTGWEGKIPTASSWRRFLCEIVSKVDWKLVTRDVENFLETPSDIYIFSRKNILSLLRC